MAPYAGKRRLIVIALIVLGAGTCLGAEPAFVQPPAAPVQSVAIAVPQTQQIASTGRLYEPPALVFRYATDELWQYLRKGLNYLESPRPCAEPEEVSPLYIHPDGRGYGCYGFSPEAYEDVQRLYPFFRQISWERILRSPRLYDLANQAFCDWLIKNLQDYCPQTQNPSEIFNVVQQAWNLGLNGFRRGRKVVISRMRRAEEFKAGQAL